MNSTKQKQIYILIVLAISFLIEAPLSKILHSILAFSQPLANLVTSAIFYVALFICFMILLKPDITSNSVVKTICLTVVFFVTERIISALLISVTVALIYEIIKPIIIFVIIFFGYHWILKSDIRFDKVSLIVLCGAFVLGLIFNISEYIRVTTLLQNTGDNLFSYFKVLASANSVYSIFAKLCLYVFTFVLLAKGKE